MGKKLAVFSQSGLEWLYRIYQEPRRMWKRYATTNPVFVWMVAKEYIKTKFRNLGIEELISTDYPSTICRTYGAGADYTERNER